MTDASTRLPLDGVTVVSLEQAVAAPYATRHLADLGARVIKVERPGGGDFARRYDESVGGESSYFVWANRSKESITLDVKDPAGLEVLHRLLASADVFVQNLAPGATARLDLSAGRLQERYPTLIVCDVSGYGADGPWSQRKAYDMLAQSEVGLISLTGTPDQPAKVGISIADIAAAMYAYTGILTALLVRGRTGRGSHVQVSLFDALTEWVGQPAAYAWGSGTPPPRAGTEHATIAPYGPFACADGVIIVIGVQNDPEWETFCSVFLARPELAADVRFARNSARVTNRAALNEVIAARFASLASASALTLLKQAGVANARQNTMTDLLTHPVLIERDRFRWVPTPSGDARAVLPPVILSGTTPRMDAVPALGQQTDSILTALGYSRAETENLRLRGVV